MTNRQKEILKYLLKKPNHIFTINELKDFIHCSEKTVRTDLEAITTFLEDFEDVELLRKRGLGVVLTISDATKTKIYESLFHVSTKTNEERMIEIAYQLLTSSSPVTLKDLAETYYTHTVDIRKDIDYIREWLEKFKLELSTKQREGNRVIGEELHKRNALAHLSELVTASPTRERVLSFFDSNDITIVQAAINKIETEYELALTDEKLESLIIHALIMIKRTRQRTTIKVSEQEAEMTIDTLEYQITEQFIHRLETQLSLTFPEHEKIYYTWHLSSSTTKLHTIQPFDQLTEEIVQKLIEKVQYFMNMPFSEDLLLVEGLTIHLNAVLKRISHGFHITNPMLDDVKKLYPYVFNMVVFSLNELKEKYNYDLPEEEIAYLVIHFQAAVERMNKRQTIKRTLVVCHMGIGVSRLLQAKLEQQYTGLQIIDCIGKNDLSDFLAEHKHIDFIISTLPLIDVNIPHIVITPLLDTEDKSKLNQFIQEKVKQKETASNDFPVIQQQIESGLFQRDVQLDHPFQIVERLARQLFLRGAVGESFIHEAVSRERMSFTAIGGGIAIPHAQPSTVRETTISFALLKKPITWGTELVSIVFLIAVTEEDRYLTKHLLKEISKLSNIPSIVEKLRQAQSKEDVLTFLRNQ